MGPVFHILIGGLIRSHHAGSGTRFDRHVADGHPTIHGECADGASTVFQNITGTTPGANLGDDRQNDVLCGYTGAQITVNIDRHRFKWCQRQCLSGQHVLHFAGANTKGHRTKSAMGGGVRITTDDGGAGHRET